MVFFRLAVFLPLLVTFLDYLAMFFPYRVICEPIVLVLFDPVAMMMNPPILRIPMLMIRIPVSVIWPVRIGLILRPTPMVLRPFRVVLLPKRRLVLVPPIGIVPVALMIPHAFVMRISGHGRMFLQPLGHVGMLSQVGWVVQPFRMLRQPGWVDRN